MSGWPGIAEEVRAAAAARGVVILGAGQAGGRAAEALRRQGFGGAITLVGDEAELPYERPSLSKDMLIHPETEKIDWVQTADFYREHAINFRLGDPARRIDPAARIVELAGGACLDYGALILATGARVRRLDIPGVEHVRYVRTLADSRALRDRLAAGSRLVVIGAGFIGLEVAAAAVARGAQVTVLEMGAAPLGRVVPAVVGAAYRDIHEARGVAFRFGARPVAVHEQDDGFAVELADGERLAADTVVAGIGVIPNAELAVAAGLAAERGVITDEFAATSDPAIFASIWRRCLAGWCCWKAGRTRRTRRSRWRATCCPARRRSRMPSCPGSGAINTNSICRCSGLPLPAATSYRVVWRARRAGWCWRWWTKSSPAPSASMRRASCGRRAS
jgi:NAD(P)H-nitrite reductase large subunit